MLLDAMENFTRHILWKQIRIDANKREVKRDNNEGEKNNRCCARIRPGRHI